MKKILTLILSLILTVVVLLLIAPLFYSLDEMRPRIEQEANSKLRGEIKIGHLSFSLFPNINIGVEQVELKESKTPQLAAFAKIEKIQVKMPLWSLISSPKATLIIEKADIAWLSDSAKGDTLTNFLPDPKLAREASAEESVQGKAQLEAEKLETDNPVAGAQKQLGALLKDLPTWISDRILKAKFSFEIMNSRIDARMVNPELNLRKELSGLEFKLLNIGFNSPVELMSKGVLNLEMKGVKLQGPFDIKGAITMIPNTGDQSEIKFSLSQNLNDISIQAFEVLDKKAGTPLQVDLAGKFLMGELSHLKMHELGFVFGGVKTQGNLDLSFSELSSMNADLLVKSENIDLAGLAALVPMIGAYKLKGQSNFSIAAKGNLESPDLAVDFSMNDVSGSTPELAHPIEKLKGEIMVRGKADSPTIDLKNFSMKLGRSDMSFWAKVKGIEKINLNFGLQSQLLDVDHIMGVEAAPKASKGTDKQGTKASKEVVSTESLDSVLEAMAPMVEEQLKNEMLDRISLKGKVAFKKIRVVGAEYGDAELEMNLSNRKLSVSSAELGAYEGRMSANMDLVLNPGMIEYSMDAGLKNISIASAMSSHAPEWKDDITGTLVGKFKLSGKGMRKAQLAKHLRGSLTGSMKDGRLKMPVLKTLSSVLDKLPTVARDKAGSSLGNSQFKGEFKTLKLDAAIEGRKVVIKDLDVVYDPLKAQVGDFQFKTKGTLTFDREIDFDALAMVSPNLIKVPEWKGKSGLIEIPLLLKGTMDEPKPDYAYTTKILVEKVGKGVVKKELQKLAPKVIDKLKEKAPAPVKKQIDDIKKKFGF